MKPENIAAIVTLVSVMLGAGLEINVEHLVDALKNYGLLARALVANFIVVPIFAVLLARAFHLDEYIAIGLRVDGARTRRSVLGSRRRAQARAAVSDSRPCWRSSCRRCRSSRFP